MCYNCGCRMPDDDHGDERNITNRSFEGGAEAMNQSPEDARRNTLELLKDVGLATGQLQPE